MKNETNPFLVAGGNNRRKTLKVMDQTGKRVSVARDRGRLARLPGKRVSRTGKVYWETRQNRSDRSGTRL